MSNSLKPSSPDKDTYPVFLIDLGGVLIKWRNNDPIYRFIAERYGVPFIEMRKALWDNLPEMESGRTTADAFVKKSMDSVGRRLMSGDTGERLWLHPFAKSASLRIGVVKLVGSLRNRGYSVYCLSNISAPHLQFIRNKGWTDLFDGFFASCELGCVKPQPEIFRKTLRAINTQSNEVMFVDDNPFCIAGAKDYGISNAVRYRTISQMKKAVRAATSRPFPR